MSISTINPIITTEKNSLFNLSTMFRDNNDNTITEQDKQILLEEFERNTNIKVNKKYFGRGGTGEIYKGTYRTSRNEDVSLALKCIFYKTNQPEKLKVFVNNFKTERKILENLHHQNIIKKIAIGIISKPTLSVHMYYFALEMAENRDLNFLIQGIKKKVNIFVGYFTFNSLSENFCRFLFNQVVQGFFSLYINNVIHFDIKPENLLLMRNYIVKISDFSISQIKSSQKSEQFITIPIGTHSYMPPESFTKEKKINKDKAYASDIYSLGVTLYSFLFIERFLPSDNNDCINNIKEKVQKINNSDISSECKDLLYKMLQIDYNKRIDPFSLLDHDWLFINRKQINAIPHKNSQEQHKFCIELEKSDIIFSVSNKKENTNEKYISHHNKFFFNYSRKRKKKCE